MKKVFFTITFSFLFFISGFSQGLQLSEFSKISILTIGPGDNLVDCFGHSAIRVKDPMLKLDMVFNYGTYDFEEPNFYGKFAQGKLLYNLGYSEFIPFFEYYKRQKRYVKEQVLNLNILEKQNYFNYLSNNIKPQNRKYLYDFFYDNCATKLRDISEDILKEKVNFSYKFTEDQDETLRDLIHNYSYSQPWGTFGIDLALGSVIDRKAKSEEYAFLPDYIFEIFKDGKIFSDNNSKPLVSKTNILFQSNSKYAKGILSPLIVFSLLAILVIYLTYRDYKRDKRNKILDFILFFVSGIIGVIILLLWFATDHSATGNNFNILWAFPFNLVVAFFIWRKNKTYRIHKYLSFLILLIIITTILWILNVQVFNIALIPILAMLFLRYFYLKKLDSFI